MSGLSKILLGLEGLRALCEYGAGCLLNSDLLEKSPKGDGHPVLILPGLATGDGATSFIRSFLQDLGYVSYGWDMGRNMGPRHGLDQMLTKVSDRVKHISQLHDNAEVSVIGWSLGGIYGREIAKLYPEVVRQVITLGTPFKGNDQVSPAASFLYEMLSKDSSHKDPEVLNKISMPPPVPFTSIYSKTDGVVYWENSIEIPGPMIENIEVANASHMGLAHNPASLTIIADRLTQTKSNWSPYQQV